MNKKTCCVLGAGGFIGSHLATRLKKEGYWVRGVDLKYPEFSNTSCDEFIIGDLREPGVVSKVLFAPKQTSLKDSNSFDLVCQLAANMGGALFVFSGDNDAEIMHDSSLINLHTAHYATEFGIKKIFYSSSACIYPQQIQEKTNNKGLKESDAYPVNPDSEYGYEKIFSERLYQSYHRNFGLNIRIARFHNIFGEEGTYKGGKEKAPAAICRKVVEAANHGAIIIWGDGKQTRSFLYIEECIEGIMRLLASDYTDPINIGSDELISINDLAKMAIRISGKKISIKYSDGPQGVRGRNSDNTLIKEILDWKPEQPLEEGIVRLFHWINQEVNGLR